jgi:hypothetical protein
LSVAIVQFYIENALDNVIDADDPGFTDIKRFLNDFSTIRND